MYCLLPEKNHVGLFSSLCSIGGIAHLLEVSWE